MKTLNKRRDAAFDDLKYKQDDFVWAPKNIFDKGFDAAVNELRPEIDKFVDVVDGVSKHATHVCPNNAPYPVEQCVLCMCLETLDTALTRFKEFMGDGECG